MSNEEQEFSNHECFYIYETTLVLLRSDCENMEADPNLAFP